MIVTIKHILIEVKELRIGYTVRIDRLFGIVTNIKNGKATVNFTDGSDNTYRIEELTYCVVKFLAIMKDLNSFPIIHGNFSALISYFNTKEKVADFVNDVRDVKVEGNLRKIMTYPRVDDVVELSSLKIAEKNNLMGDRNERIGYVLKINGNSKFTIQFPSKRITMKRGDFNILNSLNFKQVFEIDETK